jgi:intracellular multiplication protein IcmD
VQQLCLAAVKKLLEIMRLTKFKKIVLLLILSYGYAYGITIGDLSENVTKSFRQIGELMIALSYIAGIGFGISSVFKFKQHKDNPTQIPIGTPFALLAVSIILVFLPGIYAPAGESLFGENYTDSAGGFTGHGVDFMPGNSYSYQI